MICEGNQEIEEVADKYQLTFLHIDCTSDKKKDKKLPTNAWIVTYLDRKDGSCLLYTSPSPRDVEESRMPSSA